MPLSPHDDLVAAMMALREIGAKLLDCVTDAVTLAPHHLFALVAVAEGATSLGAVAAMTDRHLSSVSRTVDQLVQAGLVVRDEDPDDRRQVVLRTTETGGAIVARQAGLDHAVMHRLVDSLPPGQAATMADGLRLMVAVGRETVAELEGDPDALVGLAQSETQWSS